MFETTEPTAVHRLPATRRMGERRVRWPAPPTTAGAAATRGLPDRSNDGVKVSGTVVLETNEPVAAQRLLKAGVGVKVE
jgi:hypothetical protein